MTSELHTRCLDAIAKRREVSAPGFERPWRTSVPELQDDGLYSETDLTFIDARWPDKPQMFGYTEQPEDAALIVAAVNSFDATTEALASIIERHAPGGIEELVLHMDEPCSVCEDGGHMVTTCSGCFPTWEDARAYSVFPCPDYRDAAKALNVKVTL